MVSTRHFAPSRADSLLSRMFLDASPVFGTKAVRNQDDFATPFDTELAAEKDGLQGPVPLFQQGADVPAVFHSLSPLEQLIHSHNQQCAIFDAQFNGQDQETHRSAKHGHRKLRLSYTRARTMNRATVQLLHKHGSLRIVPETTPLSENDAEVPTERAETPLGARIARSRTETRRPRRKPVPTVEQLVNEVSGQQETRSTEEETYMLKPAPSCVFSELPHCGKDLPAAPLSQATDALKCLAPPCISNQLTNTARTGNVSLAHSSAALGIVEHDTMPWSLFSDSVLKIHGHHESPTEEASLADAAHLTQTTQHRLEAPSTRPARAYGIPFQPPPRPPRSTLRPAYAPIKRAFTEVAPARKADDAGVPSMLGLPRCTRRTRSSESLASEIPPLESDGDTESVSSLE